MNHSSPPKSCSARSTTQAEQWALRWSQIGALPGEVGAREPHPHTESWAWQGAGSPVSQQEEPDGRRNFNVAEAPSQAAGRWEGRAIHMDVLPQTPEPSKE